MQLGENSGSAVITRASSYYPRDTDNEGGRLQAVNSANTGQQVLQQLGYHYDPNGNITQISNGTAAETSNYTCDAQGARIPDRLTEPAEYGKQGVRL